ncbi:MAG: 16S rRNA (guanine(527)-N(7))-methyltransferase RsmG [Clostridia bacterium]|nr:16S rRNA (guanine(527)-N(7))-methyltransferase RsmG [Clostridia bacterium]
MTTEMLSARLQECGIAHDAELPAKLLRYHELLLDWNTRMDLTAVIEEAEMIDKHYVDSLIALAVPGLIPENGSLIDVGTGAGFPGLPLALACPNLRVTLMDAQQKRLNFLQAVIDDLGVRNVTLVHARAEDGAQFPNHREKYDVAVARAVASLAVLSEYLLPYVKVGGKAVCWKGPALMEELPQGRKAAYLLGGKVQEPISITFPGRDWQHMLLPIAKAAKTARQYPRKAGTPGKSPLGGNDKK